MPFDSTTRTWVTKKGTPILVVYFSALMGYFGSFSLSSRHTKLVIFLLSGRLVYDDAYSPHSILKLTHVGQNDM